ncbi:hypothetical protein Tco_1421935, partial [Tanacetum coccineum]
SSIAGRGGGLFAKRSIESKEGLGGIGLVVVEVVDADGDEVKGSGVDLGVVKSLLGEIPGDVIRESDGEALGVDEVLPVLSVPFEEWNRPSILKEPATAEVA